MLKSFYYRYSKGGRTLLLNFGLLSLVYGAGFGWDIYQDRHQPVASWEETPKGWEVTGRYEGLGQFGPVTLANMWDVGSSSSLMKFRSSDDLLKTSRVIKNQVENELFAPCEALKKGSRQFQWAVENRNELMVVNGVSLPAIDPNKPLEILRMSRSGSRVVTAIIYIEDNAYTVELLTYSGNRP